jgi:hypothetical protein
MIRSEVLEVIVGQGVQCWPWQCTLVRDVIRKQYSSRLPSAYDITLHKNSECNE